jgi:aryl-alcohol dehydrogenase-like predicted oxidoreductase
VTPDANATEAVRATRALGARDVFPIALGGASWSFIEDDADERGIETIHAAIASGVTLIDTAHVYTRVDHPGHSEALIARALATHPDRSRIVVATKGGHYRDGDEFPIDARPDTVRRHCQTSLELLGVERLDLYQLHWPDPNVPMRDAMKTFAELQAEGLIDEVGLSNVSIAQLEEARSVVPIVSVQNTFSPFRQDDRPMLDYCSENSIAYLSYSPLRGPDSGNLATTFPAAAAVAASKGISIERLTLAWLLALSPAMIPISGAGRPATIRDSAQAPDVILTEEDLAAVDF